MSAETVSRTVGAIGPIGIDGAIGPVGPTGQSDLEQISHDNNYTNCTEVVFTVPDFLACHMANGKCVTFDMKDLPRVICPKCVRSRRIDTVICSCGLGLEKLLGMYNRDRFFSQLVLRTRILGTTYLVVEFQYGILKFASLNGDRYDVLEKIIPKPGEVEFDTRQRPTFEGAFTTVYSTSTMSTQTDNTRVWITGT